MKKTMFSEFYSYVKLLEETKRDVEKIIHATALQAPTEDRLQDMVPRLKRILERIVYGCLAAQIPVYGKKTATRRWQKSKPNELVKKVDPRFYPNPTPDRGGPYIQITPEIQDSDALTQEQWLTAWNFVNQIQHVQNPTSEKHKPDPEKALNDALKWTQRIVNLLSHHTVIATDSSFFVHATMHSSLNGDALVEIMESTTDWLPSQKYPDGTSVTLQIKDENDQWKDVEDPEEGGICLMRLHGLYTRRGFLKPSYGDSERNQNHG